MTAQTSRFALTYPTDSDEIRTLPTILKSMAESVDTALDKFDYKGGDSSGLTSRVASLETLADELRTNYVVLFDNDDNQSANITLSESAANFKSLTVCYKDNDGIYFSTDVFNPNGKKFTAFSLLSLWDNSNNKWGETYLKTQTFQISGKSILPITIKNGDTFGQTNINENTFSHDQILKITQVIGKRKDNL